MVGKTEVLLLWPTRPHTKTMPQEKRQKQQLLHGLPTKSGESNLAMLWGSTMNIVLLTLTLKASFRTTKMVWL